MFVWNYRMIKVSQEGDDEIGLLAEVIYDKEGNPVSFVKADLITFKELEMAYKDALTQEGHLLTYFYDNGLVDDLSYEFKDYFD